MLSSRPSVAFASLLCLFSSTSRADGRGDERDLIQKAEAARTAGQLGEAAALYDRAIAVAAPFDMVPVRGACEVTIEREENGESGVSSRKLCRQAFIQGATAEDLANEGRSMLVPGAHVTLDDLATVSLMAEAATSKGPLEPWGPLLRCAMARRLGNVDGLQACWQDLRRVAPSHPATLRELARPVGRESSLVWLARWLVILALTGTLAHAASRRRWRAGKRARSGTGAAIVAAYCLASVLAARPARAELESPYSSRENLSQIPIDDGAPEKSIPSPAAQMQNPLEFGYLLQDFLLHAKVASERKEHERAARYYKALTLAAPQAAVGPSKWCEELEILHRNVEAAGACRLAIVRGGAKTDDYARFVRVVTNYDKPLSALQHAELQAMLDHLDKEPTDLGTLPAMLRCEVGTRFEDVNDLTACTTKLAKLAPNDPKTVLYRWTLAMAKHDDSGASAMVKRAREVGMAPAGVEKMEQATDELARQRMGRLILLGIALVMLAFGGRAGWRWVSARRRVATTGA